MNKPRLYIVIPCYNEEKVLPETSGMFLEQLNTLIKKDKISDDSRILFVNDGSKDSTWDIICKLSKEDIHYKGISQSRNRGHQSSLLAGLMEAKGQCDITISIDCDGQDDIHAMEEMVDAYVNGYDIVYGVRSQRERDSFLKRFTAQSYYKVLKVLGADIVYNHADYRLLSNRVLEEFADFEEVNLFLRGLIPLVGFESTTVYYERYERIAGESHYTIKKMVHLAVDGITSLSVKPLTLITFLGLAVTVVSMFFIVWAIVVKCMGQTVGGWTSLLCVISFLGGIQLFSLGVIGTYIGKIYMEVKRRPRYIISERTEDL